MVTACKRLDFCQPAALLTLHDCLGCNLAAVKIGTKIAWHY